MDEVEDLRVTERIMRKYPVSGDYNVYLISLNSIKCVYIFLTSHKL